MLSDREIFFSASSGLNDPCELVLPDYSQGDDAKVKAFYLDVLTKNEPSRSREELEAEYDKAPSGWWRMPKNIERNVSNSTDIWTNVSASSRAHRLLVMN